MQDWQDSGRTMTSPNNRNKRSNIMRRIKIAHQRFAIEHDRGNHPAAVCALADELQAKAELSKLGRRDD
jgi:hypothetical protein